MHNLYIISGCNGAGKTTASFTILPEMLKCEEFINADEIAKGISPLNPEKSAIEAGRIMLSKIDSLLENKKDFAVETTLASRSYVGTIRKARKLGYQTTLIFFWLDSTDLAVERVKNRVKEGGHNVAERVILRRYFSGAKNLFNLYIPICDYWMIFDKSKLAPELIAEGYLNYDYEIKKNVIFAQIKNIANYGEKE